MLTIAEQYVTECNLVETYSGIQFPMLNDK